MLPSLCALISVVGNNPAVCVRACMHVCVCVCRCGSVGVGVCKPRRRLWINITGIDRLIRRPTPLRPT